MKRIEFTVFGKPEPQGSSRAFIIGGKARITSANPNLYSFRQEVTKAALRERGGPDLVFGKHVPVRLTCLFTLRRPPSIPKKRIEHVVRPDVDKLLRGVADALKGAIWHDDAQVIEMTGRKQYRALEGVHIVVEEIA